MDSLTEQLRMANESSSQFAVTSIHGICQDAEWSESRCKSVERHKPNVAPLLCCHLATRNDTKQHRPARKPMWQWNKGKGWGSILHFCIIGLMEAHTLSYGTTLHSITTSQHVCMIFSFKATTRMPYIGLSQHFSDMFKKVATGCKRHHAYTLFRGIYNI